VIDATMFGGDIAGFFLWWALVLAAHLAVIFPVGFVLTALNKRHPDRRIQKRTGEHRTNKEILAAMPAVITSSGLLSFGMFAQAKGWTIAPYGLTDWQAYLCLLASMALFDAWFFFAHWGLHTKPLYPFHLLHHRSVAPTPWSNDSSSVVDTLLSHSFYALVLFVLPLPIELLIVHRLYDQVTGMIGHSGFEFFASRSARWPSIMVCTTYHDLHHSEFHYNFGNFTSMWDRLFGTLHPNYDQIVREIEETGTTEPARRLAKVKR